MNIYKLYLINDYWHGKRANETVATYKMYNESCGKRAFVESLKYLY